MFNYDKARNGIPVTIQDILTERVETCVFEYEGDITDLTKGDKFPNGSAYIELECINRQLEKMQKDDIVRNINYGSAIGNPDTDQVEPIPVTFEVRLQELQNSENFREHEVSVYGLDSADNWDWRTLKEDSHGEGNVHYLPRGAEVYVPEDEELDFTVWTNDRKESERFSDSDNLQETESDPLIQ